MDPAEALVGNTWGQRCLSMSSSSNPTSSGLYMGLDVLARVI